jgi:hypothetical protein
VYFYFGFEIICGFFVFSSYLMTNPPYSTSVPTPAAVKKAGIPAPPDLIFSAKVP